MNNHPLDPFNIEEPDFEVPDFVDEPSSAVPAAAPFPKVLDPAALAQRLGWTLDPSTQTEAHKIGAALGLRHDDIMWPLILLQLRTVGIFGTVPAEVASTVKAVMEDIQKAAKAEIDTAAIETARNTKKEIFRVLAVRDNNQKGWHDWVKIVSITVTGVVVGFGVGNTVAQFMIFKKIATIIYGV